MENFQGRWDVYDRKMFSEKTVIASEVGGDDVYHPISQFCSSYLKSQSLRWTAFYRRSLTSTQQSRLHEIPQAAWPKDPFSNSFPSVRLAHSFHVPKWPIWNSKFPCTAPPPSAVRFLRNAFSASPAVQIRPGPLGSLAELRKYRRKSPDFFLKTWQLQRNEEVPKWATQCSVWFQVVH